MTHPKAGSPGPAGPGQAPSAPASDAPLPGAWLGPWNQLGRWAASVWDVWQTGWMSPESVSATAQLRLDRLVSLARERSPFHRQRLRDIAPGPVRLQDLPVLTKRELMDRFDEAVTDPEVTRAQVDAFTADEARAGHAFLGRYAVWTSSGSTGKPGIFINDAHALAVYDALEMVRFQGLDLAGMLGSAVSGGDRYVMVGATGGHFAGNATVERMRLSQPWLADRMRVFSIMQSPEALIEQLNEFQPTYLATYPTAACMLAGWQRQGRLRIRPRQVWVGGEQLSDGVRHIAEQAFGCPIREEYGASEFLPIAMPCRHGTLHVNADWVLLEPVDEHYRPVPAGVTSHTVLLTNLANHVQPLIRYDLGDSVTWMPGCECGSRLPAIRVEGRCDDVLTLQASNGQPVMLLPLALTTVMEDELGVYRFQLLQDGASGIVARLDMTVCDDQTGERCRAALLRFLCEQGLPDACVQVTRTTLQPNQVSGKLRRVIARAGPAAPAKT